MLQEQLEAVFQKLPDDLFDPGFGHGQVPCRKKPGLPVEEQATVHLLMR
jgi:hypothetical protein